MWQMLNLGVLGGMCPGPGRESDQQTLRRCANWTQGKSPQYPGFFQEVGELKVSDWLAGEGLATEAPRAAMQDVTTTRVAPG